MSSPTYSRHTAAVAVSSALICAMVAPSALAATGGNISINWNLASAPSGGVTDITFPITVSPEVPHQDGTYYAQQFSFTTNGMGYIGLQPRSNLNGHERLHAAFSSFTDGTKTTDSQCSQGADGGPGVSCSTEFDGVYGHEYALTVKQTGPDTWAGTATDTVTGISSHIGEWKLPSGSGNLAGSQGGSSKSICHLQPARKIRTPTGRSARRRRRRVSWARARRAVSTAHASDRRTFSLTWSAMACG
jgi:hypothetical protein